MHMVKKHRLKSSVFGRSVGGEMTSNRQETGTMTELDLEMIRHGWTPIDEERLVADRALSGGLRSVSAGVLLRLAGGIEALASWVAVDRLRDAG